MKIKSDWKMQNTTCWISKKDLQVIGVLLSKGYPIQKILLLLDEKYEKVVDELEKGRSVIEFIPFHKKDAFYERLKFFMNLSSFSEAIELANEVESMQKNYLESVLKQVTYPLFVLLLSIGVFFLFEKMIYPQLITFVNVNEKTPLFFSLMHLFLVTVFLFLFGITLLCGIIYGHKSLYHVLYDKFLIRYSIIKSMLSMQFATHLLLFMKKGYSTRQILHTLTHLLKETPLKWMAIDLVSESERGDNFIEMMTHHAYLSDDFRFFFKTGYYAQTLETTLNDYIVYQKERFFKKLKQLSIGVSLFAYLFIAVLVAMIYQMLLTPLEMLTMM